MSYQFYQLLHLLSIIGWVSSATLLLLSSEKTKLAQRLYGVFSLTLFVAGFGLLARLGISMQPWVWVKAVIWLVLAALVPVIKKRAPEKKSLGFFIFIMGVAVAASLGVYHP